MMWKSSITIKMKKNSLSNITPGEILEEEYLKPMGLTQYSLAKALCVPQIRVSQIIRGERRITADTALRLGIFFETGPDFWLVMQSECDLRSARQKLEARIRKQVRPFSKIARS
jgi:addiction module HigA family antidote